MQRGRPLAGLVLLAVTFVQPPSSRAERPKRFALNWVRDANAQDCIGSHDLALLIEQMLGPVFVAPAEAELAIEGRVSRKRQWRAQIAVTENRGGVLGTRTLTSTAVSCRALDAQIVLVMAMAIDPEIAFEALPEELIQQLADAGDAADVLLAELRSSASTAPRPAEAPNPTSSAAAMAKEPPPTPRATALRAPRAAALHDFRLALSADFALGLGLLPELGSGAGLSLAVQPLPRIALVASARLWFENEVAITAPTARAGSVSFHLVQSSLGLCLAAVRTSTLRWSGCLGVTAAMRWTASDNLERVQHDVRVDLGPMLSSELWFGPVGPVAPLFGIALRAPLRRDRFGYRDTASRTDRALFRPSLVEGWAFLGAAFLL